MSATQPIQTPQTPAPAPRPSLRLVAPAQAHPSLATAPTHGAPRHKHTRAESSTDIAAIAGLVLTLILVCRALLWLHTTPHSTVAWTLTAAVAVFGVVGPPLWAAEIAHGLARARARRCTQTCCRGRSQVRV